MPTESVYGRGLTGLLKRGWHEIPGVMGSSVFGLIGLGMFGYIMYVGNTRGFFPTKYKRDFMIVRPDDPKVKRPVNPYPQQ